MSRALTLRAQLADAARCVCVQLASNEALTSTAGCSLHHRRSDIDRKRTSVKTFIRCSSTVCSLRISIALAQ